jgi:hypothetical protein
MMKDLSQPGTLRFEATPFHPMTMMMCQPLEFAIFNDGVPSMMATCEAEISEIVHGIQDDALDEGFPPDAQEAAELEEVDLYNEMQALLILMEEREEDARSGFKHLMKRWEVRRRQGVATGSKPKAVSKSHMEHKMMHSNRSHVTSQAIVPHTHHVHKLMEDKAMQRNMMMKDHAMQMNKAMNHHHSRFIPIHQPRKMN